MKRVKRGLSVAKATTKELLVTLWGRFQRELGEIGRAAHWAIFH